MKPSLFTLLFFIISHALQAIDTYQPGDTFYIWAVSGLTLRKEPSLKAIKLATIPYGTMLIAQNYSSTHDFQVEAVPGINTNNQKNPPVMLGGGFAKVVFQGDTGYVFDGYVSKLPVLKRTIDKETGQSIFEYFDDWAARSFKLVAEKKQGTGEYGTPSFNRRVYGNGFTVISLAEKGAEMRIILPDVSLEEAFMIFNYMYQYEWEIRHSFETSTTDSWSFAQTSEVEWIFGGGLCGYKILYLPKERISVITSECSC